MWILLALIIQVSGQTSPMLSVVFEGPAAQKNCVDAKAVLEKGKVPGAGANRVTYVCMPGAEKEVTK